MPTLTTARFVLRRLTDDWKLLLSIFAGITVATTLIAGTLTEFDQVPDRFRP